MICKVFGETESFFDRRVISVREYKITGKLLDRLSFDRTQRSAPSRGLREGALFLFILFIKHKGMLLNKSRDPTG